MTDRFPSPIPAATLVVFRDASPDAPELLMVERAKAMAFAGGATVFPGGRVDPADRALAAVRWSHDPEDGAARVAAIREILEEAGIAIGLHPVPDAKMIAAMRAGLNAGRSLGEVAADAGATIDLSVLTPFARWQPDRSARRVFDTRFFLARLPDGSAPAQVDGTENTRLFWATAARVLEAADNGSALVIYPTRRNLERLARFASYEAAVADARAHPPHTIIPFIEERDGERWLCIAEGCGYPITAEREHLVQRG